LGVALASTALPGAGGFMRAAFNGNLVIYFNFLSHMIAQSRCMFCSTGANLRKIGQIQEKYEKLEKFLILCRKIWTAWRVETSFFQDTKTRLLGC
jgi:hypothetical protein